MSLKAKLKQKTLSRNQWATNKKSKAIMDYANDHAQLAARGHQQHASGDNA